MSNMSDLSIALKSTEKSCTFSLSDTPLIRNVYVYPDRKKKKKKKRYSFNIIRTKFIRYASYTKLSWTVDSPIISFKLIDFCFINKQITIDTIVVQA